MKRVLETGENRPHLIIHRVIGNQSCIPIGLSGIRVVHLGNQSGIPIGLSAIKAVFYRVIGNQSCIPITLCSMDIFKNEEISEICENRIIVSSVASVKLALIAVPQVKAENHMTVHYHLVR